MNKGFIATISVMILSLSTLGLIVAVTASVVIYQDMSMRKEMRYQAHLNVFSCLESATIMKEKDIFLAGDFVIEDFGCKGSMDISELGLVSISVETDFHGVKAFGSRRFDFIDYKIGNIVDDTFFNGLLSPF